jgi:mRNA interferase RelE/StbE
MPPKNKKYKVIWEKSAKKDFKHISYSEAEKIIKKTELALSEDPYQGKPLKADFKGLYRYRIGDYRVIYSIYEQIVTVTVLNVGHRKNIYN